MNSVTDQSVEKLVKNVFARFLWKMAFFHEIFKHCENYVTKSTMVKKMSNCKKREHCVSNKSLRRYRFPPFSCARKNVLHLSVHRCGQKICDIISSCLMKLPSLPRKQLNIDHAFIPAKKWKWEMESAKSLWHYRFQRGCHRSTRWGTKFPLLFRTVSFFPKHSGKSDSQNNIKVARRFKTKDWNKRSEILDLQVLVLNLLHFWCA